MCAGGETGFEHPQDCSGSLACMSDKCLTKPFRLPLLHLTLFFQVSRTIMPCSHASHKHGLHVCCESGGVVLVHQSRIKYRRGKGWLCDSPATNFQPPHNPDCVHRMNDPTLGLVQQIVILSTFLIDYQSSQSPTRYSSFTKSLMISLH